jgi:gluconokinase
MGVAGSGKSAVAERLAATLGWSFAEGDAFHPRANVEKMARATPLNDEDRAPWLDALARWMTSEATAGRSGVVACSALKRAYRDRLRLAWPSLRLVFLDVARPELERRLVARTGHFFPGALLESQLATLEPPQDDERAIVVRVDAAGPSVEAIVALVVRELERGSRD